MFLTFVVVLVSGCANNKNNSGAGAYKKFSYEFFGSFDTVIQFMGYAENQDKFNEMAEKGQNRFLELSRLYDIYNDYEGINNIKTINDNAGIKPVEVRQEIIDLIKFSKEWYDKTSGVVNIAMGPVLSIWHDYREEGINDPNNAKLPDMQSLREAAKLTDISKVEIDTSNKTVFLKEKGMSLDVGAVAKGFATEMVARELESEGYTSFIISAGGNIRVVGKPLDGVRNKWGVGIQDPDQNTKIPDTPSMDIVFINDMSLVSSGDYERYYVVNGKRYHHLIDPVTLMPSDYYRQVTIVTKDSGMADALSTAAFLLPYDKSRELIESLEGVDALWVMPDRSMKVTDNLKGMLKNMGGATNK